MTVAPLMGSFMLRMGPRSLSAIPQWSDDGHLHADREINRTWARSSTTWECGVSYAVWLGEDQRHCRSGGGTRVKDKQSRLAVSDSIERIGFGAGPVISALEAL